jgi:hypothetical protein
MCDKCTLSRTVKAVGLCAQEPRFFEKKICTFQNTLVNFLTKVRKLDIGSTLSVQKGTLQPCHEPANASASCLRKQNRNQVMLSSSRHACRVWAPCHGPAHVLCGTRNGQTAGHSQETCRGTASRPCDCAHGFAGLSWQGQPQPTPHTTPHHTPRTRTHAQQNSQRQRQARQTPPYSAHIHNHRPVGETLPAALKPTLQGLLSSVCAEVGRQVRLGPERLKAQAAHKGRLHHRLAARVAALMGPQVRAGKGKGNHTHTHMRRKHTCMRTHMRTHMHRHMRTHTHDTDTDLWAKHFPQPSNPHFRGFSPSVCAEMSHQVRLGPERLGAQAAQYVRRLHHCCRWCSCSCSCSCSCFRSCFRSC